MKSLVLIFSLLFSSIVFSAEPPKDTDKKQTTVKNCDPLKQKDCKKKQPSGNKPVPKKSVENK